MKKYIEPCSISRLHELFRYNELTGEVFRRISVGGRGKQGEIVGTINGHGYYLVGVDNKKMQLHRVIMAIINCEWPKFKVDHRNGNTTDNRSLNLRLVTCSQNSMNKKTKRKPLICLVELIDTAINMRQE